MKTRLAALALSLAAASLCACNNSSKKAASTEGGAVTASAPVNTVCPFSGSKANPNMTVAYHEKTVAFCCAGCKGKFNNMTDEQKAAMVNKVASTAK